MLSFLLHFDRCCAKALKWLWGDCFLLVSGDRRGNLPNYLLSIQFEYTCNCFLRLQCSCGGSQYSSKLSSFTGRLQEGLLFNHLVIALICQFVCCSWVYHVWSNRAVVMDGYDSSFLPVTCSVSGRV